MKRSNDIWLLIAATVLSVTSVSTAAFAETFLKSESFFNAPAYEFPVGVRVTVDGATKNEFRCATSAAVPTSLRLLGGGTFTGMPSGASAADTLPTAADFVDNKWAPVRTLGEVVLFNTIMTLFGRYILEPDNPGFVITSHSIANNFKNGFEWDDNMFSTNNFRHPYQGAQYFGAARANGYGFYTSCLWSFFGAWLYEYVGESHHPAYNDWVNTSLGGIGLGEPLYRLQLMALDNTATGSSRVWRELGGFFVLPLSGFNRLITGEAFEVHQNPPGDKPEYFGGQFMLGTRTLGGGDRLWKDPKTKGFIEFGLNYGNPYEPVKKPYDAFNFRFQVTFDNRPRGLSRIQARGRLASGNVHKTEKSQHLLGADQVFTYVDNDAYTYGGQSLAATFGSRFWKGERFEARAEFSAAAVVLGASRSDYANISGRDYDYGPGGAYGIGVQFFRRGISIVKVSHIGFWIHSVNGTRADHYSNITEAQLNIPIKGYFGAGFDYALYLSERHYADFTDVSTRNPELKLYITWLMD